MADRNEQISLEKALWERAILEIVEIQGGMTTLDVLRLREALASTQLAHPEVDWDVKKTRTEWDEEYAKPGHGLFGK